METLEELHNATICGSCGSKATCTWNNLPFCGEVCYWDYIIDCPQCEELEMEQVHEFICSCFVNEQICQAGHHYYIDWDARKTIVGRAPPHLHKNPACLNNINKKDKAITEHNAQSLHFDMNSISLNTHTHSDGYT